MQVTACHSDGANPTRERGSRAIARPSAESLAYASGWCGHSLLARSERGPARQAGPTFGTASRSELAAAVELFELVVGALHGVAEAGEVFAPGELDVADRAVALLGDENFSLAGDAGLVLFVGLVVLLE